MEQDLFIIWDRCLQFMKDNLNAMEQGDAMGKLGSSFHLLFDRVQPISLVNNNLTIGVPSDFYKEYIEENYLPLLSAALRKNIGKGVKLWYSVLDKKSQENQQVQQQTATHIKGMSMPVPKPQEIMPPSLSSKIQNPLVVPGLKKISVESNLNPVHSFDNFVEGESNKFAFSAAKIIAKRPGETSFNPMFIYGGVGVGKTHIAQAIGLEIKNTYPDKVVHYLSSEKFIQQFIKAANSNRGNANSREDFANFYKMLDVLIVDDIQFLSGKRATQDSFFHIFDYLHQNGKQIILTSDKAPADIMDIEERVVSRFKWGLTAEIKSPDYDTRRKIIVDKLHRDGIALSEDMIDFLAGEVQSNVRELIGVINAVIAYSTIYKSDLTLDLLKETINKISANQKKVISIPYIQEVVCDYFGIKREQLLSKTRKRDIALPRQLAMYFAKEFTDATFTKIGEEMGGKDHSTVMYACDTVKNTAEVDKQMRKYIKELKEKIRK
ncbi:chromosomal replication initiator protein DnaA [Riemerella anatipestifer]|uniref:Chromosomal replication initiator protein DnaA n=2 Tax=Riemerella anatipestifer TaxID=34085 RepID=E4TAU7_RIEAD|nr:chromosomal replication initiator protein DnaA [Riemerella anatipestifer]ADQ81183.1 chromosomal replication initiator protein DnaA [Riemerella anatipestifer ATCC 11845 = DSM 15868]ADZ11330.1 DnaA [Riemerella anatipestifer RA-GD]AFD55215.1 chromosomal replication initiator protein dnaa [Riemerella anatipestifer ATCC 11845 = DSM 15868]AGC40932.1 ATPase involved in DNA replication initiation [Riemerella anatipestifer RA-CH-2]AKP68493.1 chromosomal replication initiator protein dnaa [Riemerella